MGTICNKVTYSSYQYVVYLQYLTGTDQLKPEMKEKAMKFMNTGYQRELTYRHDDGSFSAFGKRDDSGQNFYHQNI